MEHIGSCEERLRWEQERDRLLGRIKDLQTEKEAAQQAVSGARSKEKLRSSAENQVMFNEAIRKVIEEKDKKISSLELSLKEKMSPNNQSLIQTLEDQLAEVQRNNAQLESELSEAQNKLKQQMTCSVMPLEASESMKQLQEENLKLKQELSRSASSLISGGRVSVTSADRGDLVLVIWSEEFSNYQIYQEVSQSLPLTQSSFLHLNLLLRVQPYTSFTQRVALAWSWWTSRGTERSTSRRRWWRRSTAR